MIARITFNKCIQDSQDFGSNDEHMVSRVFFVLEVEGRSHTGLYADIKQSVGGNFDVDRIEVSRPERYRGPLNYEAFRNAVENYYRGLVGSQGTGIRISGASNVRMRNNTFIREACYDFEIPDGGVGW